MLASIPCSELKILSQQSFTIFMPWLIATGAFGLARRY